MDARVYIFDEIDGFTDADFVAACAKVSPQRRRKALSYRNALDRKLSVVAELLLRHATGVSVPSFRYAAHGKPEFVSDSLPRFNLSHCRQAVACAICDGDVGVDVETYDSYGEDVARVVFNAREQAAVLDNPRAFAQLWTVKESLLKYTGEGLTDHLPTLLDNLGPDIGFATYHSPKGYACTLCTSMPDNMLIPHFVDKTTMLYG